MRYDNIIRFLGIAFVVGAVLGLGSGLVLGGDQSVVPPSAVKGAGTTTTTVPMTAERAREIGANEMGQIMVLMYHNIKTPELQYARTPQHLREDIQLLKTEGYYPINVRDLYQGTIDVPMGKTPVVLTFDDSSPGQYRLLADGTVDPDSAVGIMQASVAEGGWAAKASFFVLLEVTPPINTVFGQPEYKQKKLQQLVQWGYEVGSHTITHLNLKKASNVEARKQLAQSKATIEKMVGDGYQVTTLAVPFGIYPSDDALFKGQWEDLSYDYKGVLEVTGGGSPSPFSTKFEPLHIHRIEVAGDSLKQAIQGYKDHPELRYVSDGDPTVISAPTEFAKSLGQPLPDLGRPLIRY
jgi:peptidoglycan/xylan/chitin deacetylase (PgdA/CDA1 family)